jgi:FixJ family two-component response regulator
MSDSIAVSRRLVAVFAADAQRGRVARITPRERQVFERIVRGKQNKQIASELGSTERAVKAHRQRVMEKMKVRSLAELVSVTERFGLSTLNDKSRTQVDESQVIFRKV